ncbi:LapA family protein [Parasphingorhabdus halotolerans]|uniref:LapA family protein n=1 Tax=Parasphingorhabdus halotolerans TaxID=2725558 RepID=A0A6H2DHW3_9SPHN|nr:LapA family protein [Parasphingorhabdus halotolerans]QJB67970.1 LapA family protein [Parasphingorhabdus halotolerans]
MQFIKILLWVLLLVGCFIFWWSNETRSSLDVGAAIIEARVSTFALGAFLAGFVPTWLLWRTSSWRLKRRIKTLEDAARPNYTAPPPAPAPLDLSKEQISTSPAKPAVSPENTDKAGT